MENEIIFDIIVFENTRFCPSTRKREGSVFRNLHSSERFRKDMYSGTVFYRVGGMPDRRKKSPFSNKKIRVVGALLLRILKKKSRFFFKSKKIFLGFVHTLWRIAFGGTMKSYPVQSEHLSVRNVTLYFRNGRSAALLRLKNSCVWTEALPDMILVAAKKLYSANTALLT